MEVWVEVNGQFSIALLFHQSNPKDLIWILLVTEPRSHTSLQKYVTLQKMKTLVLPVTDCDSHTAQYSA